MVEKYESKVQEGFNVRLEARLKNASLVEARELAGLTAKEAAEKIGLSYGFYLNCESMKLYPSGDTQHKICEFYRKRGVFLYEEDVFPKELKEFSPRKKYIAEKSIPKENLISISTIDRKLLPSVEPEVDGKLDYLDSKRGMEQALSGLAYREEQVIRMRFGLNGEPIKTLKEVGEILNVNRERIRIIEARALCKLKKHGGKTLKGCLRSLEGLKEFPEDC